MRTGRLAITVPSFNLFDMQFGSWPNGTYRRHIARIVVGPAEFDRLWRIGIHFALHLYGVHVNGANGRLLRARLTARRDCKRKQNQNHLIKSCRTEKVAKPQNISCVMLLLRAPSDMRAAVKVNSLRPAGVWPSGRQSTQTKIKHNKK